MWTKSQNAENIKPPEKVETGTHVIVRKDYKAVPASEDMPAHYEYLEWQMTAAEYEIYKGFEKSVSEQAEASVQKGSIVPVEDKDTASQDYAKGKFFFRHGKFCKAKAPIAKGARFTLGTNYTVTSMADELFSLLSKGE